jgi:regulatory protein
MPTSHTPYSAAIREDKPPDAADIRRAAMDLLARREHSNRELRHKLQRRFGDTPLIEEALARLAEENLQSDERYAGSYVRQRAARGYGPVRIRQEMRERGLDKPAIATALERAQLDWRELAAEVSRKKFGETPPGDASEQARRLRFLHYRGFDADDVRDLLGW